MLSASAERSLPYAPTVLFDLAADLEQYPQFVPGWLSAQIYYRGADVCMAEQAVGFGPMRIRFKSMAQLQRPERIEITSDDSQFRHFHLQWRFEPVRGGKCRAALLVELELRSRFLQGWLERAGPGTAAEVLRAFERRAGEIHGAGRGGRSD